MVLFLIDLEVVNIIKGEYNMIDIVIVNYNYDKYIIPLLDSLNNCNQNILQKIIVVDNNSSDNSKQLLLNWFRGRNPLKFNLQLLAKNFGYAKAVNFGVRQGNSKYIMILNADMLVLDKNWKEKFLEMFQLNSRTMVVGCKLIDQFNKVVGSGVTGTFNERKFRVYGVPDNDSPKEIFNQMAYCVSVCGAAYMTRRHIFQELGGFDEDFFMYYEEEYFSFKVQKLKNGLIAYTPFTKFLHYSDSLKSVNENLYLQKSGKIFEKKCREELGLIGINS